MTSIMEDITEENEAGRYEIIRNKEGINGSDRQSFYRIYIPAPLTQMTDNQLLTYELRSRLHCIYKEIGKLQGLSFYENNLKAKNRQLYKQEMMTVLENRGMEVNLTEIFSNQMTEEISKRKCFYECIEEGEDITSGTILLGKVRVNNQGFLFRKNQIGEEIKIKEVSLREYNPPTPEYVVGLMKELECFTRENNGIDVIIQAGLICYQFLTIMPYEEDNEIWVSILLNRFFREQGIGTDYYIPFARYILGRDSEWKRMMRQVRETGDYCSWVCFFVYAIERAISRTSQLIMQLEKIAMNTLSSIGNERQKTFLQYISNYMQENPIFVIGDIEKTFHTAYNTAAKSVIILEKHGLIKEISQKQRYRVYCYEQYIQEILK